MKHLIFGISRINQSPDRHFRNDLWSLQSWLFENLRTNHRPQGVPTLDLLQEKNRNMQLCFLLFLSRRACARSAYFASISYFASIFFYWIQYATMLSSLSSLQALECTIKLNAGLIFWNQITDQRACPCCGGRGAAPHATKIRLSTV